MNIVLVHGAGGTPATWSRVSPLLADAGHRVVPVTNPLTSLRDDAARTTETVRSLDGPVLLAGHSYGGAVITEVGREPNVTGLVYVAAFGPDEGETVNGIVERYPPAPVARYMRRGANGEWESEHTEEYWAEIAWDITPEQRATWDRETRRSENAIFAQPVGVPAWRSRPSWYLVAADDATLRPEIQRDMAARMGAVTVEVPGSHFTPQVRPEETVALILRAAA
jgi:pimeloyl-ACP methyl ester carboxylesterase